MDNQFQEFEQEFKDEIPSPVMEDIPSDAQTQPEETFSDGTSELQIKGKENPFSIGFYVLCLACVFALVEFIRTIAYFF